MRVLLLASAVTLWSGTADAQVSVPLPGARPSPAPPRAAPTLPPVMPDTAPPQTSVPLPSTTPPATVSHKINPYNRDIQLTVPLTYHDKVLGEIPILITRDDRFAVYRPGFQKLLDGLLNPNGKVKLDGKLGQRDRFFPEDLAGTGISLQYDPESLSIVVLFIEPGDLQAQSLFERPDVGQEQPDLQPAKFSGYVNFSLSQSYDWSNSGQRQGPSAAISGAFRYGPVVLEGEGQLIDQTGSLSGSGGYQFQRNFLRLVYDQPQDYRRWYLGDLTPEVRADQGYVQLGGLGVSRQRRRFNLDRTAILQGNRQIVLQRDSTVSIYRNGVLFRQQRLSAGPYDLSSLPLLAGSNDVEVQVRDDSGRVQNISYQSYSDPIDLVPGDYEYSANIGFVADRLGGSPAYGRDIAFTGFYRKSFLDRPAIGVGLQLSRDVQQVTGQTQFYLFNSGRLQFDGGFSHTKLVGNGYSGSISYDQSFNRGELVDSFVLRADYESRHFAGLGASTPDNSNAITFTGQYTRAITFNLLVTATANYIKSRDGIGDSYRFGVSTAYRFNPRWSVRVGGDYARFSDQFSRQNGLGAFISLVFQPNYRSRAEARYDSGTGTTSLAYNRSSDGRIGSLGYGALLQHDPESTVAEGYAEYTGNRFDASFSQSTYGPGFGGITNNQVSSLQVGTAIAFADGHFGVSRRITDSFAILYPHHSLEGHSVVAGQSLEAGDFVSRSGTFGGAVNNYLASYVDQSITYDVDNPPPGYDIGPGTYRVHPPYRSGYAIEIGTDSFVSATGTLLGEDGKPVSLIGGGVVALDKPGAEPIPFFTNTVGRFAVQNLRPGGKYRVDLADGRGSFEIDVPASSAGLVQMDQVKLGQGGDAK
ncbi:MAG: fimbria/pilus outer membrane usher protein [Sphingomonas sp.]